MIFIVSFFLLRRLKIDNLIKVQRYLFYTPKGKKKRFLNAIVFFFTDTTFIIIDALVASKNFACNIIESWKLHHFVGEELLVVALEKEKVVNLFITFAYPQKTCYHIFLIYCFYHYTEEESVVSFMRKIEFIAFWFLSWIHSLE